MAEMLCKSCKQPLMEMDFNTRYYAYFCDNWRCPLHRQPQGCREKPPAESGPKKLGSKRDLPSGEAIRIYKSEATLRLIKKREYGAKAMERRVKICCASNPDCPFQDRCFAEYKTFVNAIDNDGRKEIYHQLRGLGIGSVEARANMSARRVKKLKGAKHG
jgi:hypothetical protein